MAKSDLGLTSPLRKLIFSSSCCEPPPPVESLHLLPLLAQGFVVIDGLFGAPACAALRAELLGLYAGGGMTLNHTHLVKHNNTQLLPKTAIHEAELSLDPKVSQHYSILVFLKTLRESFWPFSWQTPL